MSQSPAKPVDRPTPAELRRRAREARRLAWLIGAIRERPLRHQPINDTTRQ